MAVEPRYTLTLDERVWLPVPLRFPWGAFESPDAWASELAVSLLDGTGVADEGIALLRETALTLQQMPSPLPGAQERFWRTATVGGRTTVVHLYVTETEVHDAAGLLQLARAGIGGAVQAWRELEGTHFACAVEAVVIAEIDERDVAAVRWLGLRDGHVFLLDLLDENPLLVEAVQPEMERVFRSVRFA